MEIGSLLIILALVLLAGIFVSRPFSDVNTWGRPLKDRPAVAQAENQRSALLAERDRILAALQELDADHLLGKVTDVDYPAQRAALVQSGATVLQQLDAAGNGQPAHAAGNHATGREARRRLQLPEDELEAQIAARRAQRSSRAAGFCPKCGKPVQKSDRFCSRCGTTLDQQA